jgi:glutamate dehydrogenase
MLTRHPTAAHEAFKPALPDVVPSPVALAAELGQSFKSAAETIVPWFVEQMPRMYFEDTPPATVASHLRAIIAARASGQPLHLTIRSEDEREWTMIRQGNRTGVLAEVAHSLPMDTPLRAAKIHSSRDGVLVLDTFEFGERVPFDPRNPAQAEKLRATIEFARQQKLDWTEEQIREYFACCAGDYLTTLTPHRLNKHRQLVDRVSGTDGAYMETEPEADPSLTRITIAFSNARTRTMLERTALVLSRAGIGIQRAYLDQVADPPHGSVTMLGFVIQSADGCAIDTNSAHWKKTEHELHRIKWVDFDSLEMANRHASLSLDDAELLLALCTLAHQSLVHRDRLLFSIERIVATAERTIEIVMHMTQLFRDRFDPDTPISDAEFAKRASACRSEIAQKDDPDGTASILTAILEGIEAVYRTNYFVNGRYALSMRIDPQYLRDERRPELPYGTFFVFGRGYFGFHNRFKEIARGGLRVIRPVNSAQHSRERDRLFDEVYELAFAQELKNKDIPEGGAKAVILVQPGHDATTSVRAFADAVIDLITPEATTQARVVDLLGNDEWIYFGPDENITPAHIEWIVERAKERGYPFANALMSSKPGAGINHKEFGVTSEGINVFLEVGLNAIGIDPRKQSFSLKLTGGPDGDVAGNEIKIAIREFGKNVRFVGVADGFGVAEDPRGLDHAELMRLVTESLPISRFDRAKLSPEGKLTLVTDPEGARLRNDMHNRVESDVFVPAGGRPQTINGGNWMRFLGASGAPASKLIVEGANVFITDEARKKLVEAGVVIIKDSSANKCGVICSSFEIGASMLLDQPQFMAIKSGFVAQVLVKLREFARAEAELLMAEGRRQPTTPLSELSTTLSKVIVGAADAIRASMDSWSEADRELAKSVVREHIPQVLQDAAGPRLWTGIPQAYLDWMVAKRLASTIVYREGIGFLQSVDPNAMAGLALRYMRKSHETRKLVETLRELGDPSAKRAADLLERAGARAALQDFD